MFYVDKVLTKLCKNINLKLYVLWGLNVHVLCYLTIIVMIVAVTKDE